MIKPILPKINSTELFCHKYWKRILKDAKPLEATAVYHHPSLTDINFSVLRRNRSTSISIFGARRMIPNIDKEFKLLPPTTENLTLWRGVAMPNYRERKFYDTFNRAYNVKKGDIIHMPEYAYAAPERKVAEWYTRTGTRNIIYEIEVPKGARISHSFNYVFPRYSKFECIDINTDNTTISPIKHIKLRYILPDKL